MGVLLHNLETYGEVNGECLPEWGRGDWLRRIRGESLALQCGEDVNPTAGSPQTGLVFEICHSNLE